MVHTPRRLKTQVISFTLIFILQIQESWLSMESKDGNYSGEMGLTPEASALRTEISNGHLEAAPNAPILATIESGSSEKRKRGRPKRSRSDEADTSSAPTVIVNDLECETPVGQLNVLDETLLIVAENSGEVVPYSSGLDYLAHAMFIDAGEDISMKIISFCQQGPQTVFVLACNGFVSIATLRHGSSNEVTIHEGLFEIIKLSGSFTAADQGGGHFSRAGGLTLAMTNSSGGLVVGSLAGRLIAAGSVQLLLGSYHNDDKQKSTSKKLARCVCSEKS